MAHRDCMKKLLLQTHSFSCEYCKAQYAIGRSQTRLLTHITPGLITSWLGKTFLCFVTIVITILLIIYVTSFDVDSGLVRSWKIGLIVLFSIVLSLLLIYIIFVVRLTVKKLRRSDIEIYCNQTEIALHTRNSKEILQDYFDNMAQYSQSENHSLDDYEMINYQDQDGNSRKDLHEPTNSSLLQTVEGNNRYRQNNLQNMENILHLQDDEDEIKVQKRYANQQQQHHQHQHHALEIQDHKPTSATENNYYGQHANIGKIGREPAGLKRYPPEPIEEISSIKFDVKALANDSFHSVANIIKGEDAQSEFSKPNTINQTEQTPQKEQKVVAVQEINKNNQSQNYYSQDNSNVHEFDDIEPNFEIS